MVCLGLEPGAGGWKVQTNPLSYYGTPIRPSSSHALMNLLSCFDCQMKKLVDRGGGGRAKL